MSEVLITGGAGFIGCELSRALLAAGHRVTCLDVLHPQVHAERGRPARLPLEATLLTGDVTQPTTWDAVLRLVTPQVVVHLAAETGTGQSFTEASRHGSVNVVGTTQLLDGLLRHDAIPDHLVVASSRAVYGEGAWQAADGRVVHPGPRRAVDLAGGTFAPLDEGGVPLVTPLASRADTTAPAPSNIYAATKLAQEHVLAAWCAGTGAALSALRLQNVYGPGQSLTNSYTGVLALFARLAAAGERIDVYEDGEILRDFVHVADVVQALTAAVTDPPRSRPRLLDVGYGQPVTIVEVARRVAEVAGAPEPAVSGRFRAGDVRAASCDISRTTEELGYVPTWPVDQGLADLVAWVRETS